MVLGRKDRSFEETGFWGLDKPGGSGQVWAAVLHLLGWFTQAGRQGCALGETRLRPTQSLPGGSLAQAAPVWVPSPVTTGLRLFSALWADWEESPGEASHSSSLSVPLCAG